MHGPEIRLVRVCIVCIDRSIAVPTELGVGRAKANNY